MSQTNVRQLPEHDGDEVLQWRLAALRRAGYGDDAAAALALAAHVDLHAALDLVRRGCPPETALRVLL